MSLDPSVKSAARCSALAGAMRTYINHENIRGYRKLIAISEGDSCRDEARHQTLLPLLAEEQVKKREPNDLRTVCRMGPYE
jgi:hypothetical protein